MINLEKYLMGRDKLYPSEWTAELRANAEDLLKRVNNALKELQISDVVVVVSSGWRPAAINAAVGGAKKSLHMEAKAVDLKDPKGLLAEKFLANVDANYTGSSDVLNLYGLWLEDPAVTKGWIHLDTGRRTPRLRKIFKP